MQATLAHEPWVESRDGDLFCLACNKFVTAEHIATEGHLKRVQWFLEDANTAAKPPEVVLELPIPPPPPTPPRTPQRGPSYLRPKKKAHKSSDTPGQQSKTTPSKELDRFPWWQNLPLAAGIPEVVPPQRCVKVVIMASSEIQAVDNLGESDKVERTVLVRSPITIGQNLRVHKDFLEFEKDAEDCGFLVIWAGETVCVLHVGGAGTEDADWVYAKVTLSHAGNPVNRVGWLPASCLICASYAH